MRLPPFVAATLMLGLSASLAVVASAVGETRFFGVRTIIVEADDRTIEVESRAVAD